MTIVTISLEERCTVAGSGFDPLAQGAVRVADSITLDVLYEEIYFNNIGRNGVGVSKKTGRPIEEISDDYARNLYATAEVALKIIKQELGKSVTKGGFGLARDDLSYLARDLGIITAAKNDYFAEKNIKEDEHEIDFSRSGLFGYNGLENSVHVYTKLYRDHNGQNHPLTVKVSPTSRNGIYLFRSEAMLKGASEPFYTSRRYVDLINNNLSDQLKNEYEVLKYYINHALRS